MFWLTLVGEHGQPERMSTSAGRKAAYKVIDNDVGSLSKIFQSNSPADAGGAAGDDGSLALKQICGWHAG